MRKSTFLFIFLSFFGYCFSQQKQYLQSNISQTTVYNLINKITDSLFYERIYSVNYNDTNILRSHFFIYNRDSFKILTGISQDFNSKGKLSFVNFYNNGLREGIELRYKDGSIMSTIEFKNDTINGFYTSFYSNGSIKERGKCYRSLSFKYGPWTSYYPNGNIQSVKYYSLYDDINKSYSESLPILKRIKFPICVKKGEWFFYDINKKLKYKKSYAIPEIVLE